MQKQGIELSINVLIIAVIALLVLVVLAFLLLSSTDTTQDALACIKLGGVCKTSPCTEPYVMINDAKATAACASGSTGSVCCRLSS